MRDKNNIASGAVWISITTNAALFGFKYWAGILTGSTAIIADAWHTLSDSVSSVVVLISIRIAKRPPDKQHPFGHGRADLLAAIIIGVFLTVIGIDFFVESVRKLILREAVSYGTIAVIAVITSIVVKEGLAQYSYFTGKKTGNVALRADAWHHRSDALSSVIILAGILIGRKFWWTDGVLGIMVTAMLLHASYSILKTPVNRLLGEKPDEALLAGVREIIEQNCKMEVYAHHFHIHMYGEHRELTFHIKLPDDFTLARAHGVAHRLEEEIRSRLGVEATIHMEPIGKK